MVISIGVDVALELNIRHHYVLYYIWANSVLAICISILMRRGENDDYVYFSNMKSAFYIYIAMVLATSIGAITVTARKIFHDEQSYDFFVTLILEAVLIKAIGLLSLLFMVVWFYMTEWTNILQA